MRFYIPNGDWEKIPRLEAKTLISLRHCAELPKDITKRLRYQVPFSVDNEVPQARTGKGYRVKVESTDTKDL